MLAGTLAKPAAESKPEGKSDADALVYFNLHGYWPVWYFGYHLIGKRSAEDDAKEERKSDADAWLYYLTYGYWPVWYTGCYWPGKRSADAKPEGKYDADKQNLVIL